jgi:hypothetical protein
MNSIITFCLAYSTRSCRLYFFVDISDRYAKTGLSVVKFTSLINQLRESKTPFEAAHRAAILVLLGQEVVCEEKEVAGVILPSIRSEPFSMSTFKTDGLTCEASLAPILHTFARSISTNGIIFDSCAVVGFI